MILVLNILLATCGLVGSFVAIGGNTWRKDHVAWIHRVTARGWVAITCLILAFTAGIAKEVVALQNSEAKEVARTAQDDKIIAKISSMETLLTSISLQIIKQANNPEDESAQFRRVVQDSGFPEIAKRLYRPTSRVQVGVNIRSEPSSDSPAIGRVEPGTPLRWLQTAPRWILVQTPDGVKGWVSKTWVEDTIK